MTPDCSNSASIAADGNAVPRTVCPSGMPCELRPDFTATIGLVRDVRRAIRLNLRGFPIDSRYSSRTSVLGSSSQNCIRSLPLTSARLPAETNEDSPSPRATTVSSRATPRAPDWEKKPMRPCPGMADEGALQGAAVRPGLGEARGHDDQAAHVLGRALLHHLEHRVGRDRHHGQGDLARDVEHRPVRRQHA